MPKSQFIEWDTDHKGAGQVDTTALPEYVTSELAAASGDYNLAAPGSKGWECREDITVELFEQVYERTDKAVAKRPTKIAFSHGEKIHEFGMNAVEV